MRSKYLSYSSLIQYFVKIKKYLIDKTLNLYVLQAENCKFQLFFL